jgi:hypothetical protein
MIPFSIAIAYISKELSLPTLQGGEFSISEDLKNLTAPEQAKTPTNLGSRSNPGQLA